MPRIIDGVAAISNALHSLRALHRDAEPRNILCDEDGKPMAVDLERAEYRDRQPLGQMSPSRKRKSDVLEPAKDDFVQELTYIMEACREAIGSRGASAVER